MQNMDPTQITIDFKDKINSHERKLLAVLMRDYQCERRDLPVQPVENFENSLKKIGSDVGMHFHLAYKQNRSIKSTILTGYAILEYRTNPINDLSFSTLQLYIHPRFRNNGIAIELLKSVLDNIPDQIKKIQFYIDDKSTFNSYLGNKYNIEYNSQTRLNVSNIRNTSLNEVKEIIRSIRTNINLNFPNIHIIKIKNEDYPKSNQQFAELMETIWNGIPGEDAERDHEDFPVERLKGRYQWFRDQNADFHAVLIRDNESERYIGFTELMIRYDNQIVAEQSLTGVDPKFRGYKLAYLMKLYMLQFLVESTDVKYWITANANENPSIEKINKKLGYSLHKLINVYTLSVEEIIKLIK